MPVFQVAFFKFKPDADPAIIKEWIDVSKTMPELVPCVRSLNAGRPVSSHEHLAKGWDLAAFVELDSIESATEFHEHPAHVRPRELCYQVCDREQTVSIVFEV